MRRRPSVARHLGDVEAIQSATMLLVSLKERGLNRAVETDAQLCRNGACRGSRSNSKQWSPVRNFPAKPDPLPYLRGLELTGSVA